MDGIYYPFFDRPHRPIVQVIKISKLFAYFPAEMAEELGYFLHRYKSERSHENDWQEPCDARDSRMDQ